MNTDDRIATLEVQVRTLKRLLFGCVAVGLAAGVLAAQEAVTAKPDKPMKVELVGPVRVDGVGAIVTHTINWDGLVSLPVSVRRAVDVRSSGSFGLTVNNVGN